MLLLLLMAKARMVSADGGTIILVENEKVMLLLQSQRPSTTCDSLDLNLRPDKAVSKLRNKRPLFFTCRL